MRPDWMQEPEFGDPRYEAIGWGLLAVVAIVMLIVAWAVLS